MPSTVVEVRRTWRSLTGQPSCRSIASPGPGELVAAKKKTLTGEHLAAYVG